jgi:hypothetical protein
MSNTPAKPKPPPARYPEPVRLCANCHHSFTSHSYCEASTRCRRHPPVQNPASPTLLAVYPKVLDAWPGCGEWKAKNGV